jgi:hypothetical protein
MSETTLIAIVVVSVVTSIVSSVMSILLGYIKKRNERKYDHIKNKALLELYRENYEKQIFGLENRMANNIDRWKDTNHLLLSSIKNDNYLYSSSPENNRLNKFLLSAGLRKEDLSVDKKFVFVLTPYNDLFYDTYISIQNVCSSVGLKCSRGDEEFFANDILTQVLKKILKASIIIANIEGRNPNVFYELGIAHALDKITILITRSINELPLDVKSKRIILYKEQNDLKDSLKKEFIKIFSDVNEKE